MSNGDPPRVQIARLAERVVLCEVGNCEEPAEFLLKTPADQVRALCKIHLKKLGISDCEFGNCDEPAEFLLKTPPDQVRALCKTHLKELGISDEQIAAVE